MVWSYEKPEIVALSGDGAGTALGYATCVTGSIYTGADCKDGCYPGKFTCGSGGQAKNGACTTGTAPNNTVFKVCCTGTGGNDSAQCAAGWCPGLNCVGTGSYFNCIS